MASPTSPLGIDPEKLRQLGISFGGVSAPQGQLPSRALGPGQGNDPYWGLSGLLREYAPKLADLTSTVGQGLAGLASKIWHDPGLQALPGPQAVELPEGVQSLTRGLINRPTKQITPFGAAGIGGTPSMHGDVQGLSQSMFTPEGAYIGGDFPGSVIPPDQIKIGGGLTKTRPGHSGN